MVGGARAWLEPLRPRVGAKLEDQEEDQSSDKESPRDERRTHGDADQLGLKNKWRSHRQSNFHFPQVTMKTKHHSP